jgi:hypothetical protein
VIKGLGERTYAGEQFGGKFTSAVVATCSHLHNALLQRSCVLKGLLAETFEFGFYDRRRITLMEQSDVSKDSR